MNIKKNWNYSNPDKRLLFAFLIIFALGIVSILYNLGIIGLKEEPLILKLQFIAKSDKPEDLFHIFQNLPISLKKKNLHTAMIAVNFSRLRREDKIIKEIDDALNFVKSSFPNGKNKDTMISQLELEKETISKSYYRLSNDIGFLKFTEE